MHALGKSFRDAVGQRLDQDRAIIVIRLGEALGEFFFARASGDDEGADVIGLAALRGATKSASARLGLAVALRQLLAQRVQGRERLAARFARIEPDVVAGGIRRPEADHGFRIEPALGRRFACSISCASS